MATVYGSRVAANSTSAFERAYSQLPVTMASSGLVADGPALSSWLVGYCAAGATLELQAGFVIVVMREAALRGIDLGSPLSLGAAKVGQLHVDCRLSKLITTHL